MLPLMKTSRSRNINTKRYNNKTPLLSDSYDQSKGVLNFDLPSSATAEISVKGSYFRSSKWINPEAFELVLQSFLQ